MVSCAKADLKSPKISRLLTYLLISGKKAHSSLEIAQALWPDDSTNPAKNMRNLIYRLRQTFGLISEKELIVSTVFGYQFNPDLHIMTDYQQLESLIQLASKATSVINRVELLKNAIDLYGGEIFKWDNLDQRLVRLSAFQSCLSKEETELRLFEIAPKEYVKDKYLFEQCGITREDVVEFQQQVRKFKTRTLKEFPNAIQNAFHTVTTADCFG